MTNIQPPMENFERPDPVLTNKIVTHLKSQGIFDQFRRECMADVDTKPAYHNLRQRVEGSVAAFLRMNPWRPDMNKNQLRDNLRKHIQSGGFLDVGVDRIVDQVVNPKIYTVFLPKVEEVVQSCLAMENNVPKFEPPSTDVKSDQPKFQDKHNLAPRAKLPAPLMGPILKPLKPAEQVEGKSSTTVEKPADNGGNKDTDDTGDKKFVVDEDDPEEKEEEDEDDEESPPFEPHSEGDRLILGTRSDTSENSNDSQLVTTIVDDSLEERIGETEAVIKEENDKKDNDDDDSSSDEYVPKTPTINMEESDGTVVEFNSISEYKQYHTKIEEESQNVEEVVSSQFINDNSETIKEERSSNEEDSRSGLLKRKFNNESYDDASNSSSDRESTGDEIKPAVFESFGRKRFKLEEYDQENETSEFSVNDGENEDSCTDKSLDMNDSKFKSVESGQEEKKGSSTSNKESGKNYVHHKEHRESVDHHSSKHRTPEKNHHEKSRSSSSTKDKKDNRRSEKHESSRDEYKDREKKRSDSSNKHSEKDKQSKHSEKEREKEKKQSKSSERSKKDRENESKNKKHDHKDRHESKSRSEHDKDKKKNPSHDKHSDGKDDHVSSHKSDKSKKEKESSKHSHSSSRKSHHSSSEKHKSDKSQKHKESDKKSDKEETKKRYREHCKYNNDKDENRRSSDRDSNGPSERTYTSGSSKTRSSRVHKESKDETSERTTSNSDNTVSDDIESLHCDPLIDSSIASQDVRLVEDESNKIESDCTGSKEEPYEQEVSDEGDPMKCSDAPESETDICDISSAQIQDIIGNNTEPISNNYIMENSVDSKTDVETKDEPCPPQQDTVSSVSHHDSSSEKENIDQDMKEQFNSELDGSSTDASVDEDSTHVKFKIPKIARNIHEVKKIMEARRHLKRMEKKRMKLLMKNNSEECESEETPPSESKTECESDDDGFRGFDSDGISLEKIEKYEILTKRLQTEASQLESLIDNEQANSSLITSWIDLDPNLDTYIENTLKGKVHRKYRLHLPPICEEYYDYDPDQNCYFLVKNWDVNGKSDVLLDNNLNNLSSIYKQTNCQNHKRSYEEVEGDNKVVVLQEERNESNNSSARGTTDIIAPQVQNFSLTFNQTYDEVLKEKAQNSVVPSRREVEKAPITVMKITNNKSSEQVFFKKIQSNVEEKYEVPRISKSDTIINGKIIEKSDSKQIPLISRITKSKNVVISPTTKIKHEANGVYSATTNMEEDLTRGVSQKLINDVIGIQRLPSDLGNMSDQGEGSQSGEEASEPRRKRGRPSGGRLQQRYDSSDLYKPRPQLSSRRVRAVGSSPEEPSIPLATLRRKRSATSDTNSPPNKRQR